MMYRVGFDELFDKLEIDSEALIETIVNTDTPSVILLKIKRVELFVLLQRLKEKMSLIEQK